MVVSMSEKEFSRLSVLMDVEAGRLRVDDAAQLLQVQRRQVSGCSRVFGPKARRAWRPSAEASRATTSYRLPFGI